MQGLFRTDSQGRHICPNCDEAYEPIENSAEEARDGTLAKEQYMTGICSQDCWLDYLSIPPERHEEVLEDLERK